jgi:hypothetical protein
MNEVQSLYVNEMDRPIEQVAFNHLYVKAETANANYASIY